MNRILSFGLYTRSVKYGWRVLPKSTAVSRHFCTRTASSQESRNAHKEPLVISGISGRFPRSKNFEEFKANLYSGTDMVQEQQRFISEKIPRRAGVMSDIDKFDAGFFGVVPKLADNMEPETRMLLEATFEAIIDSGISPEDLRGNRIGVFVGSAGGESSVHPLLYGTESNADGYVVIGQSNFMIPNRMSFSFDFKGPSMHISTGCSASVIALEAAAAAIHEGSCDAAIVAGSSCYLNGKFTHELLALGALAMDGKCKSFDSSADGFTRAEAIITILIQKESEAKRSYARVRKVQSNADGYKQEGVAYPSGKAQAELLAQVYNNTDPSQVSYVECHGTGTPIGDPQELGAIAHIFCKERENPLLVGSVKSNMGHGESAAGLCGLAKVLAIFQTGLVPPNLHFKEANPECKALLDGSIKVVTEPTPFSGGLAGLNSFGLGGTNAHAILEPLVLSKSDLPNDQLNIPLLIPLSGRTKEGVESSIQSSFKKSSNPEYRALLHNAFRKVIPGHSFRGYGIIKPTETEGSVHVESYDGLKSRPIWYVIPGMGCQWNEMHRDMMKLDAFAESFNESKTTLKNIGIDLEEILKPDNQVIFNDIRLAFVAIAAVQIGLISCLNELGLKPDAYFGHSAGEMVCAYLDGCATAEETLLMNEARGRAFIEGQPEPGAMASVGLTWAEVEKKCPPGIYPACHNGENNVSVSGPEEKVKLFVQSLQEEGIFVRKVNACGMSPHSVYMDPVVELMDNYVGKILGDSQRLRSSKWISTSVPKDKWGSEGLHSSVEYHLSNMRNPVLFHQAMQEIPNNAVVVEVGPRGLFQVVLKECIPSDCHYVKLMDPKSEDGTVEFLNSIGKLYTKGVELNLGNLYPKVSFPVSSSTPSIGHLATWDHKISWKVPLIDYPRKNGHLTRIDLQDSKYSFLRGHSVGNRIIFPTTGYLWVAWRTFADAHGFNLENFAVKFQDIHLERATFLSEKRPTDLMFNMLDGRGNFEILENGEVVVRAKISRIQSPASEIFKEVERQESSYLALETNDAYKELGLRGYRYSGEFRGIKSVDNEGKMAEVLWNGNWVTFLDTVMQTMLFSAMTRSTLVPVRFREFTINPTQLFRHVESVRAATEKKERTEGEQSQEDVKREKVKKDDDEAVVVPVVIQSHLNTARCPGVEIKEIVPTIVQLKQQAEKLAFCRHEFSPFVETGSEKSFKEGVWEAIDLILENSSASTIELADIFVNKDNSVSIVVNEVFKFVPKIKTNVKLITTAFEAEKLDGEEQGRGTLMIKDDVAELLPSGHCDLAFLDDASLLEQVSTNLTKGFIALHGTDDVDVLPGGVNMISKKTFTDGTALTLMRKDAIATAPAPINYQISITEGMEWLPELQDVLLKISDSKTDRIYLTSAGDPTSGILGLVKCLRLEPGGDKLRCIFNLDSSPQPQSNDPVRIFSGDQEVLKPDEPPAMFIPQRIIESDLVFNVYKNGVWGSYRHFPVHEEQTIKPVEDVHLTQLTPGDLSSFRWTQSPLKYHLALNKEYPHLKKYHVVYSAFNFRDVMIGAGKLPLDPLTVASGRIFGWEFSGYDEEGNRVIGIPLTSSFATSVIADSRCVLPVPDNWTLEQGATVPMAYQAAMNMVSRGRLQRGQSVLIHSGAGGVGQAAINVAIAYDCEIYTTVGTEEKRKRLKELFPQVKEENIGNSRDCSFEDMIMERTNGRGVDMVLNSLAGEKLHASVRCLARNGKFIEIGAFDAFQNEPLGMSAFLKNIEFHGIFQAWDIKAGAKMDFMQFSTQQHLSDMIRPLSTTCFRRDEIESAFRYFASGKSIGKILVQMQEENQLEMGPKTTDAYGKTFFDPEKIFVIVGGLGGLGLEVANWLVDRGGRHLVLTSRSGVTTGYQSLCIRKWKERGVTVETPVIDLSDYSVAEQFITQPGIAQRMGGVFNSGLVLKDTLIENMTKEDFEAVFPPKILITKNLDILTRRHCPNLDYFVAFSSVSCGRGNAGQSNYGYANSVMERICEERVKDGLHGLAIQWGLIGEVGYVAEKILRGREGILSMDLSEGVKPQSIASCLNVLDQAIQLPHPVVSSMVVADSDAESLSSMSLAERVKTIFGIDLEKVNPVIKLTDLGMDSMILFELKQTLERDYDLPMSSNQLRHLTIGDIKAIDAGTFVIANLSTKSQEVVAPSDIADIVLYEECIVPLNGGNGEHCNRDTVLFIVHGIPGNASIFTDLAKKISVPSYGLQFGNHSKPESIAQTAAVYIEEIRKVQPSGPYNLAAYSSGGPVAFEIAAQLDTKYGEKVENLIFLDGSCCWENYRAEQHTFFVNVVQLFGVLGHEEIEVLANMLNDDLSENIKLFVGALKKNFGIGDTEGLSETIRLYSTFMEATHMYRSDYRFTGNAVLIKAGTTSPIMQAFADENFGVTKYCVGPFSLFSAEGDHRTFLNEEFVAETAVILDKVLLEKTTEIETTQMQKQEASN